MRSHEYQFTLRNVLETVSPTVGWLALLAVALHAGAAFGWLPAPRPTVDIDRTILVHQAESSRSVHAASTVLIGDSSCLMDVEASGLARALGEPVLNLATLSYLALPTHATLLREYAAANPGRLKTVVLLMHPESLRQPALPDYFQRQIADFLAGRDSPSAAGSGATLERLLGVQRLRGRLLSRVLAWPLPNEYGRFYGFTRDLEQFVSASAGSAVDPNQFDRDQVQGRAEYRLATRFETECQRFRALLPEGVSLLVGLTPTPASFVLPEHERHVEDIRRQWATWLAADATLTDLPLVLPDDQFASVAHLNAEGRLAYTRKVASALTVARRP